MVYDKDTQGGCPGYLISEGVIKMKKDIVYVIVCSVLAVVAVVFLVMSMVSETDNRYLIIAQSSIAVCVIWNIIKLIRRKK